MEQYNMKQWEKTINKSLRDLMQQFIIEKMQEKFNELEHIKQEQEQLDNAIPEAKQTINRLKI